MKNPLCDELMLLQPTRIDAQDLHSCYIVNCTLNALLIITAIIFNSVLIQALRRTSSLSKPLRTFLFSLAVSDLGVGLVAQPLYLLLLVRWLQKNPEYHPSCALYTAYALIGILFSVSSFFGLMALECRQISGHSSSSQVQEVCNSQACCLWSGSLVGFEYNSLAVHAVGVAECCHRSSHHCLYCLSVCLNSVLFQNLPNCTMPQKSNPSSTGTKTRTGCRSNGHRSN